MRGLSRSIPAHVGCIRRRPLIALFVPCCLCVTAPRLSIDPRLTNRYRSPQHSTARLMQRRTIGPQRRSVGPAPAAASSSKPATTAAASATAGGSKPPPPAAAAAGAAAAGAASALLRWRPPTPARARQWCVVARRGGAWLAAFATSIDSTDQLASLPQLYPHTQGRRRSSPGPAGAVRFPGPLTDGRLLPPLRRGQGEQPQRTYECVGRQGGGDRSTPHPIHV